MGFSLDSAEALQSCSTDTILEASSRIALLTRALKAANEATNLARQRPTVMHPPKVLRRADYLSSSSSSSSVPALPNVPPSPAPPHASPASAVPRSGPPIGSSGSSARECLRPQHEPVKVAPREDNPKREASTSSRATALLAKVPAEAEGNETPQAEQGKEATAERPSPPIWEHTRTRGCPIFTRTHPAFAALVGKADAEVPRVRVENKQAADADSNNHSSETFRAKRKSRRHRHRKIYELNRAKEAAERYLATAEQARQRSRSLFSPSLSPDAGLLRSAPLREAAGASGSAAAAAWKTARNHGRPAGADWLSLALPIPPGPFKHLKTDCAGVRKSRMT
ncbi:hypothetical protein BESB_070820 [Besnoitia besnoiti]|uniref:Uncharacterized protein n=1 Tax=Besnoitia besnoiti TaxID=94643 RepID=A0A2A9MEY3_BESBE|nr:uncharacterized protein BESB_070820 [Besnoitia besnoiti]PFH33930.1 hypothetical protein BESB_070820 [Besnoitia besnoiti]